MLLINLNLHVGICTLTGTLFKGLQTKTNESHWPKQLFAPNVVA